MKSVALTFRRAKTCPKCNAAPQNTVPQNKSVNTTLDKNKSASAGKKNTNSNSNQKLTSSGKINTSGQAPSGTEDNEFDRQYSLMFESNQSNVGDADYEIDESLKKKREARYDDSFANMTDDEKIKALEAARLARKERREKSRQKEAAVFFPHSPVRIKKIRLLKKQLKPVSVLILLLHSVKEAIKLPAPQRERLKEYRVLLIFQL